MIDQNTSEFRKISKTQWNVICLGGYGSSMS